MTIPSGYQKFAQQSLVLKGLVEEAVTLATRAGMTGISGVLDDLKQKVASDTLRVLVLGEFKRGKSTLINAILGQEVLPAFATPCTAVINEIKWGEQPRAVLHFRESSRSCKSAPERVLQHIQLHSTELPPPLEVPVEELEDYIVIPDPAKDQAASVAETPYSRVELFWPLELCKNRVEVIDSPGMNEHQTRTEITVDYLAKADAVVFVLTCQALASKTEIDFLEHSVRGGGYEDTLFVCNRFDDLREQDRPKIVAYGRDKLGPLTSFGPDGVFFLSALDALEARLANDEQGLASSGFTAFEGRLSEFLVDNRGRIKLLQPARLVLREITKLQGQVIPDQERMLREELADVEARYEKVKPQLERAERHRDELRRQAEIAGQQLCADLRDKVELRVRLLADEVLQWVHDFEPQTQLKFLSLSTKAQAETLAKEVADHVAGGIEASMNEWQQSDLAPFVTDRLTTIGEKVESGVSELLALVDELRTKVAGVAVQKNACSELDISDANRVLSAAGGWFLGGPAQALLGAHFGFREVARSVVPLIGIVALASIGVISSPLALLALAMGAGSIQGMLRMGALRDKIKLQCGREIYDTLRDKAREVGVEASVQAGEKVKGFITSIDRGLQVEVSSVRELVESVLQEKRAGETHVNERLQDLESLDTKARELRDKTEDLVFELAGFTGDA